MNSGKETLNPHEQLDKDFLLRQLKDRQKELGPYGEQMVVMIEALLSVDDTILTPLTGKKVEIKRKADGSLLTKADEMANQFLTEKLTKVYPDIKIFDEEHTKTTEELKAILSGEQFFTIDPIDGTENYYQTGKEYTTVLGFFDKEPTLAAVLSPADQKLIFAIKDKGCFLNNLDNRLRVSDVNHIQDARMIVRNKPTYPAFEKLITILKPKEKIPHGSGVWRACQVAMGKGEFTIQPEDGMSPWEGVAIEVILKEAGGAVTDMTGNSLNMRDLHFPNGIVSTNGVLHGDILRVIKENFNAEKDLKRIYK